MNCTPLTDTHGTGVKYMAQTLNKSEMIDLVMCLDTIRWLFQAAHGIQQKFLENPMSYD